MNYRSFPVVLSVLLASAALAQSVPGYTVQVYAVVTDPQRICFATDGSIYVGRDASGSGGTNGQAVKIHRVFPCGATVVEYGNSVIQDPDAVAYDATGSFSGVAGAVIVGSNISTNSGRLSAIRPDGTIFTVVGTNSTIVNAAQMAFDTNQRLVVGDASVKVSRFVGTSVTNLFNQSTLTHLSLAANGDIYTSGTDGIVRINNSNGGIVNSSFQSFGSSPNGVAIAVGPGTADFPDALYALRTTTLYAISANGTRTTMGTGFTNSSFDLEVGPDNCLYVSDFANDRILRITRPAVTSISGVVKFNDFDFGTPPSQVDIQVRNPATGDVLSTTPVTLDAGGAYSITVPASGCYYVSTKVRTWLRKSALVDARLGDVTGVTLDLINGDIDGDDIIGLFDYLRLSNAFDSTPDSPNWDADADLDGDEVVSLFDYLILSKNFDQSAD